MAWYTVAALKGPTEQTILFDGRATLAHVAAIARAHFDATQDHTLILRGQRVGKAFYELRRDGIYRHGEKYSDY